MGLHSMRRAMPAPYGKLVDRQRSLNVQFIIPSPPLCRGPLVKIRRKVQPEVLGLLVLGLDGTDEHRRVTHADGALVLGGSDETHERLQKTVIEVSEKLGRKGKRIRDAAVGELADLIREIHE